ncbi:hypothetical protein AX15_000429 [Amanita polypyramis BW_CC]|nr:hypothetical protein AX15_000429 [Amanita polypyramis BW_CC]
MVGFDVVILSDLLHFNKSHEELVESVDLLLSRDPDARAYISAGRYTGDDVCAYFAEILRGRGLLIEEEHDTSDWQGNMDISGLDTHGLSARKRNCRFWIGRREP